MDGLVPIETVRQEPLQSRLDDRESFCRLILDYCVRDRM